jgi:PAS domain S-box-containing protein
MRPVSSEEDYRRIEAELRETNERLAAERAAAETARRALAHMLERVTDAFMALDTEWRFAYLNGRAAEILGRRPEHLLGKRILTEFPEGAGHPFQRAYQQAAAEQRPVYVEEYYPPLDRWFEHRIYPSAEGLSIFFRDVTERRRADEALRDSETRLRLLIEQLPGTLWTTNRELRFTSSMGAALRAMGMRPNELVGLSLPEYFGGDEYAAGVQAHRRALAGESVQYASQFRGRHFDTLTEPLHDASGQIVGTIGIALDVTDRQRDEEALRTLSRRLLTAQEEERRRVARELHDDVGQVLTAVKIQLQSLLRAEGATALVPRLENAVDSIDSAIEGVRGLALELRPSILDDLGLAAALRWHTERFARETGIQIVLSVDPIEGRLAPEVETTCFRVVQEALTNVVRHAGVATASVELYRSQATLEVVVRDAGTGFDVSAAHRRAAEGAGMGLSGMEERVRLAGGEIEIRSQSGAGTSVRVRFAVPDAEA